jgi:hypothetical protein
MNSQAPLVGLCGSRSLPARHRKLVTSVVRSLAEAGRGIAVGCATGADATGLRACFTDADKLRVPRLAVFAAFGQDGQGSWKNSAADLVQQVSQHPKAQSDTDEQPPITISWWAGGGPDTPLVPRLKGRSSAMVAALSISGKGRGLVAFVVGGPAKSPGTWRTIRLAIRKGVPVVVLPCGCNLRHFPALGKGRWMTAGSGPWQRGWRWMPASRAIPRRSRQSPTPTRKPAPKPDDEQVGFVEAALSAIFNWKKAPPRRCTTKLDFPLFLNFRQWLYEKNYPNPIT